jgi:hypothetical protein
MMYNQYRSILSTLRAEWEKTIICQVDSTEPYWIWHGKNKALNIAISDLHALIYTHDDYFVVTLKTISFGWTTQSVTRLGYAPYRRLEPDEVIERDQGVLTLGECNLQLVHLLTDLLKPDKSAEACVS